MWHLDVIMISSLKITIYFFFLKVIILPFLKKCHFFEISVISCFSVESFFSFFSPANFSRPSVYRFSPNLSKTCLLTCDLNRRGRFLRSSKTRSQRPKNKNRSFFSPGRHVFARCDEMVKVFWKKLFCDNVFMLLGYTFHQMSLRQYLTVL